MAGLVAEAEAARRGLRETFDEAEAGCRPGNEFNAG
jgi:hypothetical protein